SARYGSQRKCQRGSSPRSTSGKPGRYSPGVFFAAPPPHEPGERKRRAPGKKRPGPPVLLVPGTYQGDEPGERIFRGSREQYSIAARDSSPSGYAYYAGGRPASTLPRADLQP